MDEAALIDAICDNFMLAVNHGIWSPVLNDDKTWTTHCNAFVHAVAIKMKYLGLWSQEKKAPLLANEMIDLISTDQEWMLEKDGNMAQYHANCGGLVIAGKKDNPHGHVCVIRPGEMIFSGRWDKLVPRVANVGKDVFIDKGVNFSFETEPEYFCLKSTLQ